jgi:phosphoribosylglycinamide formyltransferase-1
MAVARLAVFASGSGTNAENIIRHFQNQHRIRVSCVCTNRSDAYVIERAKKYHVPVFVFSRDDLYHSGKVLEYLESNQIGWIILAGFLWLMPEKLIQSFPDHIINIHPALLPKYGGKGMYGSYVHEAVINNKEKLSGISIHYVNNEYDKGQIIFQATCEVGPEDTVDTLAMKVHQLEYVHYPRVIEEVVLKGTRDKG